MAKGGAGRAAVRGGWMAPSWVFGLLALACATGLFGCDDKLPGFADPPQYPPDDAGDDAAADDDAG